MALLSLQNLHKAFGGPQLLDDAALQIERGERICLVGRNGEGKSTLLKIVADQIQPDSGELIRQPGLKVRRLRQNVPTDAYLIISSWKVDRKPSCCRLLPVVTLLFKCNKIQ